MASRDAAIQWPAAQPGRVRPDEERFCNLCYVQADQGHSNSPRHKTKWLAAQPGVVSRDDGLWCTLCGVKPDEEHVNSTPHKDQYDRVFRHLRDTMDRQARQKRDAAAQNPAADDDAQNSMEKKWWPYAEAWRAGFEAGLAQGKRRFNTKDRNEKFENPDAFQKQENKQV